MMTKCAGPMMSFISQLPPDLIILMITDQITDHYAPYCDELSYGAINEIRVLAECW